MDAKPTDTKHMDLDLELAVSQLLSCSISACC